MTILCHPEGSLCHPEVKPKDPQSLSCWSADWWRSIHVLIW